MTGSTQSQQGAQRGFQLRPLKIAQVIAVMYAGSAMTAAMAQEVPAKMDSVVVTGTLIRGAAPVGAPVTKLDREAIEKSGAASTTDLLRLLPQVQNLGADEGHTNAAQNANQNITLGSGINLRGLGPESTLTLINGVRMAPGGLAAQYTDPSTIPPLAIERMEVITDGGSATYGSDAVGGVVNIRLRKRFDGVALSARRGEGKDIHQNQFGAIVGKNWEGGNVMFAVDKNKRSRLSADDREFYTDDMRPWGGPDLRGFNANPGNIQVGSTRYAIPAGQNGRGLTAAQLVAGNPNRLSVYKGRDALPEQDRLSLVGAFSQELSDTVRFNLEAFGSERKYNRYTDPQSGNYTVRNTNPFFVSPVPGATSTVVNHSWINELGNSLSEGHERTGRVMAGLDFDIGADWSGNAYIATSRTDEKSLSQNLNGNAVNAALADTNPATALNLFCDASAFACNNPATLAKIGAFNDRNSSYTMHDVGVKFDGPVMNLPAGKLRVAVGAEVHKDEMEYYEDRNNSTPNNSTVFHIDNSSALPKRTVRSLYAEANVPLVGKANAKPFIDRLDLSLAVRADDYSDFGFTSNPKVGIDWVPANGLKIYATYGTAFRAPTLGDIDPINAGLINVVDRISADGRSTVRGISLLGGREGLDPETADITTFGVNFRPSQVRGLSLTADFFKVDYKDRILTPGNDTAILQKPELAAYLNSAPTVAQITALMAQPTFTGNTAEPVSGIRFIADGRRYNAGVVKTSGVDVAARYDWTTGFGRMTAAATANYVFNYRQQFTPTTPLVGGLLNTLNNPVRLRARAELGWTGENARVTAFANFTNAYTNATLATRPKIASHTTIDLTAQYDIGKLFGEQYKELRAALSVQDLFDRKPPFVQNATMAFDPQNTSAIGRFASLTLSYKF
ncbi:TonB-dependent receptor domain-containing protein [Massilia niastensis]|uniref:TonB-dependent receptor domain-containing protein n=1 Tax=Massilia niastensis TaxID=544911 RepID=UPI00035DDCA3|nr:TonB-dependent receptor [Massilia niastensis]